MGDTEKQQTDKKHRLRLKKKIKFEREVVSKNDAQKLLEKSKEKHRQKPPKKQKKKKSSEDATSNLIELDQIANGLEAEAKASKKKARKNNSAIEDIESPKKKKKKTNSTEEENLINSEDNEADVNTTGEKTESIRARKRKKHQQLLEEKKLKSELNFQQKCLNYLSQWKHSKSTWKFEKLKQIWIQQNMFDDARIPDEFWDTVVEYFNKAKGKIKSTIMSDALKIIEGNVESEENDEESNVKYKRARFVVQNLQE